MRAAVLAVSVLATATPALGQPLTREDLLQALKARDETIAALQKRIEALEQQRGGAPGASPPPSPTRLAEPIRPAPTPQPTKEDEAAFEALSRTLVQRGGLLLRPGSVEVAPSLTYSHSGQQGLVLADTPEGFQTVVDQRLRNDSLRATATLRVGLPLESQVELRIPYVWQRQSRALGNGVHAVNEETSIGDIELALSHQVLHEGGWRPDLIGAVSWRFPSGQDPFRTRVAAVASGEGTHELGLRATAVKTSDPLVFFSTLAYAHPFSIRESFGRIEPGDVLRWDLGTVLAVSPETSMTFGFSQEFRTRNQVDGQSIPGSDALASSLQLGVDRVLTRSVLLGVSLGVGLTRDAPDYVLLISTPIRFR